MAQIGTRTAILYIAERCNQRCVFCLEQDGQWNEFVDPSTQQVFDIVARLRERGARHITFMGGETFFRKDLDRIIGRAVEQGFTRIGVTTNGTVLSHPGFVARLQAAGLDFIELSVHGHTAELANRIAGSSITFERQAKAMAEIDATGSLHTIVNVVVCRDNKDALVDIVRYVRGALAHVPLRFKLKFVSLQGAAARAATAGDALGYEEVDFVAVADYMTEAGVDFWFDNVPLCRLGAHAHRSHELSTLAVDEQFFDLDHRGAAGYYDSGNQLEGHVWPRPPCPGCTHLPLCPGLEEPYRRMLGSGALCARVDDPVPAIARALAERGADPALALVRLEQLARQPRPERFAAPLADGAVRFGRAGEAPIDLVIEARVDGAPAYAVMDRFQLSYRNRTEADRDPDAALRSLLEAVAAAVRDVDVARGSIEDARRAASAAAPDGWAAETMAAARVETERDRVRLPVFDVG